MADLGLLDLCAPYFLAGADLGATWHPIVSALFVDSYDASYDEGAVALCGVAKLNGNIAPPKFSLTSSGVSFSDSASVSDHNPNPAQPSGAVFDWHDISIAFRLSARRRPSPDIVTAAARTVPAPTDPKLLALFTLFGATAPGATSDYPDSEFRLDLLLTVCTLHLPGLVGAKLQGDGTITPDPAHKDVTLTLPKLLITITQDGNGTLNVELDSWGAETIDDPDDRGEAQLVQMTPPYALIGDSGTVGFGFDKAILDMSDSHTPPELLSQFGVGDDWQGLYLPDIRVFFVVGAGQGGSGPGTSTGVAFDIAAHDLLIGMGSSHGVSGDFSLDVVKRKEKPSLQIRFLAADGTIIDVDLTSGHGSVQLPLDTTMVIDIANAYPPYTVSVDGAALPPSAGQRQSIHLTVPHQYTVSVTDGASPPQTTSVTIDAAPVDAALAGATVTKTTPGDPVLTPPAPGDGVHSFKIVGKTQANATLAFTPADATLIVTVDGAAAPVTAGQVVVPLNPGDSHAIAATWSARAAGSKRPLHAWFHFDRPKQGATPLDSLPALRLAALPDPSGVPDFSYVEATAPPNVSDREETGTATAPVPFTSAFVDGAELRDFVAGLPDPAAITLYGFASYETAGKQQYNVALSQRRAVAMARLISKYLDENAITKTVAITVQSLGNDQPPPAPDPILPNNESAQSYQSDDPALYQQRDYWLAYASATAPAPDPAPVTLTATLDRASSTTVTPVPPVNVPAPAGNVGQPAFFHSLHAIIRIAQGKFIACEIRLEVDFQTEAEDRLQSASNKPGALPPGGNLPANTNPDDGVVDFDLRISWDDQRQELRIDGSAAAAADDKDGLWQLPKPGTAVSDDGVFWRDLLGLEIAMMPLLSSSGAAKPNVGSLAAMAVELAIPVALAGLGWAHARTITLYGMELVIDEERGGPGQVAVLADLGVDLLFAISIGGVQVLTTSDDHPIKVRYKSVGVAVNFGNTNKPALQPVFDPSKGYNIDITDPGSLQLPGALGQIIQILGARIARTNPLNLEVDLGLAADLGFVQVDRAKLRVPLDGGLPSLTALGVTVDIPGAFHGKGYLSIGDDGSIAGSLDLTLTPIGLRIAAAIAIAHTSGGQTAVLITLEVDFPAPIVLGSSGLGIYGLLGLVGVHYRRNENPAGQPTPPLDWLINRAHGNPLTIAPEAWEPSDDGWAFGAGLVIGTLDDGIVLNLKGLLLFELPGPRLLLFMNANVLSPRPVLADNDQQGTIRAVLDLDFGRGTISIGLQVDYGVDPLFHITIPADAFFDFNDPGNFQIDLGKFPTPQVSVAIFDDFAASGYLMIHGNGLDFDGGHLDGFSLAVGFKVSLIWGDTGLGLYLKVSAGFFAGLSFSPFEIIGNVTLSGELRLFIISIGASGSLTVRSDGSNTRIDGDVCGEVDFFFFSVSGCVGLHLGSGTPNVIIPPLARGLSLLGRSPALIVGSGTDTPIDAPVGKALDVEHGPAGAVMPVVPIDAVPLLQLDFTPLMDAGFTAASFVADPGAAPGVPVDGWNRRGERRYRFKLQSITLTGPALSNASGAPPATWRARNPAPNGSDSAIDLALLDWVPQANARAATSSETLDHQVTHRWGSVCTPVAPATSVLWTFQHSTLGPSSSGWVLHGTAWPDPPGTKRSAPPSLLMAVKEAWRQANPWVGAALAVIPATVVGGLVPCPQAVAPPRPGLLPLVAVPLPVSLHPSATVRDLSLLTVAAAPVAAPVAAPATAAVAVPQCGSRVLSSPYEKQAVNADATAFARLLGHGPAPSGDLANVVLFEAEALIQATLLIYVDVELIRMAALVLRAFDKSGGKLVDQPITLGGNATRILAANQLPPHWSDQTGPWAHDALLGLEWLLAASKLSQRGFVLLITVKLPPNTAVFGLGVAKWPDVRGLTLPPSFYVAAVEGLSAAEGARSAWDTTTAADDVKRLTGSLGGDPAALPLLQPSATYEVAITFTGESLADDGTDSGESAPIVQHFRFQTDTKPPARLDPYVITTSPAAGEMHHFYNEPTVVLFATDAVTQLWAAYGVTLQGTARAGTFRPPPASPAAAKTKLPLGPLTPVKTSAIKTPFIEAVGAMLGGNPASFACVNASNVTMTLGSKTFDFYLEPATPYIFDIENPAAIDLTHPLFRTAFETSRYPTWRALAADVFAARIAHRHVEPGTGAAIDALPAQPTEQQIEAALATAGLGALPTPFAPDVTVLWEAAAPKSIPVAVLVDAPEALRRSRPEPTAISDPARPGRILEYRNDSRIWLDVVGQGAVGTVRTSPAGARVLVRLLPAAAGSLSHLLLQRTDVAPLSPTWTDSWAATATAPLVDLDLHTAPWEA